MRMQACIRCGNAKIAQLVEHNLAKVGVAGSSPVFRSKDAAVVESVDTQDLKSCNHCDCAGSIPACGTHIKADEHPLFLFKWSSHFGGINFCDLELMNLWHSPKENSNLLIKCLWEKIF